MSGSRERPQPPEFEIPDLDLPPPNRSQAAMRAVTPPASGQGPAPAMVTPPVAVAPPAEEDFALGGAALDLELGGPISSGDYPTFQGPHKDFIAGGLDLESILPVQSSKLTVAPQHKPGWPEGSTPARERLVLDPLEIRLTAGLGEAPTFGPLLAVYAIRVVLRKRALVAELGALEAELALAEQKRDDLLAELAAELQPQLQGSERFGRLLAPLFDIDALATERGAALVAVEQEKAAEAAQLAAEQGPLTTAISVETERQQRGAEELQSKADVLERAEARHKRALIEIRAVEQQAAQRLGPEGGNMPPDLVAQLLPLKERADGAAQDLESARAEHASRRAEFSAGERRLAELTRRSEQLERAKRDVARRYQQRLAPRQEGMGDVEKKRRAALAEVGRGILAAAGGVPVAANTLKALAQAAANVAALAKRAELHLRALDAFDSEKVRSGFAWIVAALALVVGYFVYEMW